MKRSIFLVALIVLLGQSPSAAWFNGDWLSRHKITVKSSQVNGTINDFPVLVDLEDMPKQFFKNTLNDGADIRVTDSDQVTELPFEIVNFSRGKRRGELYFRAPMISNGSDTDFYIYYNNAAAVAYNETDAYGRENVWVNGGLAVYQMNSNPINGIIDSSHFDKDLNENGSMTKSDSVKNKLGTSLDFDGSDDEAFLQAGDKRKVITTPVYNFDGSDDVIDFGDHDDFSFTDGAGNDRPFSITGWINTDAGTGTGTILAKHVTANATDGEYHLLSTAGTIYFRVGQDSANAYIGNRSLVSALSTNTWHHVAGTYNGSETNAGIKIYLDGEEVTALSSNTGVYTGMENTTGELTVGVRGIVAPQHRTRGAVKDVRLYSRELNADDVYKIYSSAKIIHPEDLVLHMKGEDIDPVISYDSSGNNHHGTKTNITSSTFHSQDKAAPVSFINELGYTKGTNLLTYSEEFNSGPWFTNTTSGTPPSLNADAAIAPDGSLTAERVSFSATGMTNQDRLVYPLNANIGTGTYTFSVYAREDTASSLRLVGFEVNSGTSIQNFPLGSSWQRYSITFTVDNGDSTLRNVQVRPGTDSAQSFYIWGAQVEAGNTIGNYQRTEANNAVGEFIPRDESKPGYDIFNGPLMYSGKVPNYVFPERSTAAYFNGTTTFDTNGIAADPDWDFTNNGVTVIANINHDATAQTRYLFSKGTSATVRGIAFALNSSNNLYTFIGDGSSVYGFTSTGVVPASSEQKVALTWNKDTGEIKLFDNGNFTESFTSSVDFSNFVNDAREANIGAHFTGQHYIGELSGLSIYNRTLSENEIETAFENDNYAGQNGLLAYFPMAENNGDIFYDASGNNYTAELVNGTTNDLWSQTQNGYHYNFDYGYNAFESRNEDSEDLTTANWGKITAPGQGATTVAAGNVITFGLANSTAWLDYPIVYQSPGAGNNPYLYIQPGETLYTTFTLSGNPGDTVGIMCASEFDSTAGVADVTLNSTATDYQCLRTVASVPETWFNYGIRRLPTHTASTVTVHKVHTRMNPKAAYIATQGEAIVDANVPALVDGSNIDALGSSINGTHFFTNLDSNLTTANKPASLNISNSDLMSFTRFSSSAVQEQTLYEKGDQDYGYKLILNINGQLSFVENGDSGFNTVTTTTSFNDGQIHNTVVLVDYANNGISLYADGSLEVNGTFAEVEASPVQDLELAGRREETGDNFDGRIYQMRFSDRLLSPGAIETLENNFDTDSFFYDVDNGTPLRPLDNSMYWGGQ